MHFLYAAKVQGATVPVLGLPGSRPPPGHTKMPASQKPGKDCKVTSEHVQTYFGQTVTLPQTSMEAIKFFFCTSTSEQVRPVNSQKCFISMATDLY